MSCFLDVGFECLQVESVNVFYLWLNVSNCVEMCETGELFWTQDIEKITDLTNSTHNIEEEPIWILNKNC
jgi:hypothetical protein